ncbi:MAG: hypothetical protein KKB81_05650 [Candidatus Margulisbacteria bacterium]|nr:hypothetical protein [Candidatus Margulisiibacteriota bacterium]MBU1021254.1 hypothetical protein [Candidatus Margulisiibacteriota bacterium]MBU1729257.1 hypothetical protein [Candidatus Margulisiibacteriota bacterium]MBU1954930.1 hypothetical protein [Candidatus Margulisiibacteriota bacterium]
MNIYIIAPFITSILILSAGLFVFLKDKKNHNNQIFTAFCISMFIWLLFYSLMNCAQNPQAALFMARIGFCGIVFIPILAFHFIINFIELKFPKTLLQLLYLSGIISIIFSQSNYTYNDIKLHYWGWYPTAGKYYLIFPSMFAFLFLAGVCLLFWKLNRLNNQIQAHKIQQIKYLLFAFGIGIIGVVDYLVKYNIEIYPFGYIIALIFILIIAYAILKHHLMDINVVIKKSFIYTITIGLFTGTYVAGIFLLGQYIQNLGGHIIFTALIIILVALLFQPLKNKINQIIDKLFFKSSYEYHTALKNISKKISVANNIDELNALTSNEIKNILKVDQVKIQPFE